MSIEVPNNLTKLVTSGKYQSQNSCPGYSDCRDYSLSTQLPSLPHCRQKGAAPGALDIEETLMFPCTFPSLCITYR